VSVADYQDPYAIVVLLQSDLVVVDLQSPGYPCFENPYPMDVHEAAVTCCQYIADCPSDLVATAHTTHAFSFPPQAVCRPRPTL
jgi:hypothetical protein